MATLLDDLKSKVDGALKLAVVGSILAVAVVAAFVSLVVVLFLWTHQNYGLLEAWVVLGGLFALIAVGSGIALLLIRRGRSRRARVQREQPGFNRVLQDPAVIVAGLQVVRQLSARGLLPLLIVGAVAGGLMMNRNGHAGREQSTGLKSESATGPER